MLSDKLNTNEIKTTSGVEVEFERRGDTANGTTFIEINGAPSAEHQFKVDHLVTGVGLKRRRDSRIRFDKTVISNIDNLTPVNVNASLKISYPIGALNTNAAMIAILTELLSFCATTGTSTIVYDGTGTGSAALLNGTL